MNSAQNPINLFLRDKAERTQRNYRWILNEYFRELDENPETYLQKDDHDYKEDVKTWWRQHLDEVPRTRNTKLAIMKGFFEENEVMFPPKFWKKLRHKRKGSRSATLDRVPTEKEFRSMLRHGDIKDKALFLLTMTSGMRIDEVLQLTPDMLEMNHDPPMVKLPRNITKTGDPRVTFFTPEAKEYLKEWMDKKHTDDDGNPYSLREKYINTAIRKCSHLTKKKSNDDRVFPFTYDVAWRGWNRLLKKAGLDEKDPTTNRYVLHIHCLRKYFMSQLKLEVPAVIPEALAGHEKYLDEAYRRYTRKQLGDMYKKGMNRLTVLEKAPDLTETKEEIDSLKRENEKLRKDMQNLMIRVLSKEGKK